MLRTDTTGREKEVNRLAGWKTIVMDMREPNVEQGKPWASEPRLDAGSVWKVELPEFWEGST